MSNQIEVQVSDPLTGETKGRPVRQNPILPRKAKYFELIAKAIETGRQR